MTTPARLAQLQALIHVAGSCGPRDGCAYCQGSVVEELLDRLSGVDAQLAACQQQLEAVGAQLIEELPQPIKLQGVDVGAQRLYAHQAIRLEQVQADLTRCRQTLTQATSVDPIRVLTQENMDLRTDLTRCRAALEQLRTHIANNFTKKAQRAWLNVILEALRTDD